MNSCDDCGKTFKFPSKLLRHLNRKVPCSSKQTNNKNVYENDKNVYEGYKNVYPKVNSCENCSKVLKSKQGLQKHRDICKGVGSLQCPTCLKTFSDRRSKSIHIKSVKCEVPKPIINFEEENVKLRKENELLKLKSKTYNKTINNNNSKTLNKNNITYNIIYNPETRCLTTDDPDAPSPELLCFNGFKLEAARTKLKDIDQDILQRLITNVREQRDFISFYTFFFRNIDNKRMHMFTLGKNNNTTHAQVFNNGNIEKIDKLQLFDNVCKYIGQYLLNMSIENSDVIHMLTSEQASKNSFVEVMKDNSNIFDYFKINDLGAK